MSARSGIATAKATGNESASDSDTSPADRDFAGPSKSRTISGTIKALFRGAIKAITGREEDEPTPAARRRRSVETESGFRRMARAVSRRFDARSAFRQRAAITSRYLTIPVEAQATTYLASTLDQLNQLDNDSGSGFIEAFDTEQNHISPRLEIW